MTVGVKQGITYYSDLQSVRSIQTPTVDNGALMSYNGHFSTDWNKYSVDYDNFGYGLKKTRANQGSIFSEDASKLFSLNKEFL